MKPESHQDQTARPERPSPTAELEKPTTPNEVYSTFTHHQKWLLMILVSTAATFSGFASNIYFPALPTIANDLDVSVTLVNLTVTTYMIFQGLAPSIWGAVADVKGRRMAYMCTFIVFLGACIGLANMQNYATLLVLRCLQSTGSASTIAIGSGVIGDITTRAERGGMMGVFQAGLLVPLAAGPIIGGALAGSLGWRSIFWFLTMYSGVFLIVLLLAFPETLRSLVGNGSLQPTNLLHRHPLALYQRYQTPSSKPQDHPVQPHKPIDFLAPLRILANKRAILPIAFLAIYYTTWQMSITAMSTLFTRIYHLSETQIGLTFIANGVGAMLGTLVTGKVLDMEYRRAQSVHSVCSEGEAQQEKLFPIERARLRLLPLFAVAQCGALLTFGWTLEYGVHISVPIIATFVTGWTAVSIQAMVSTYMVDLFPENSASASAAVNLARCLVGAGGTAGVEGLITALGVGWALTVVVGVMGIGLVGLGLQGWLRKRGGDDEK
ncbi:uncharacterized protein LTR77_006944 [Saxophila tyrrhenica]|uniref:Major facilitator superfamily (MFS) profile domain-containing protein n=1 Tax=Saxophila tyrrhenica TaxID=1690608 RepID=A0AAV9P681_9PEZI|nr:hypothetical protein LTR77_006944 [Saxophila tyrrhenica]